MTPVDLERLREFFDGTDAGLRGLIDRLMAHVSETAGNLHAAATRGDAAALKTEAHKAAGAVGACGAAQLSTLFSELERAAVRDHPHGTERLLEAIDGEVVRVREYLSAIRPAADQRPL